MKWCCFGCEACFRFDIDALLALQQLVSDRRQDTVVSHCLAVLLTHCLCVHHDSFVQHNPVLSGVFRLGPGATLSGGCSVNTNCLISNGNLETACASGVVGPEGDSTCAVCTPPATDACSSSNAVALEVFNAAGDDTVCIDFGVPPSSIAAGSDCSVSIGSTRGDIDGLSEAFTNCTLTFDGTTEELLSMDLNDGGSNSITLTQLNDIACGGTLDFNIGMRRKRQVSPSLSVTTTSIVPVTATAVGDPHLRGPHNERFDFDGTPGGMYTLMHGAGWALNMQLMKNGPGTRYIELVGLIVGDVSVMLTTNEFMPDVPINLSKRLAPHGARASLDPHKLHIDLCDGSRITIAQDWNVIGDEREVFHLLDISFSAPRCSNTFGGALGELFRCDHDPTSFEWDARL